MNRTEFQVKYGLGKRLDVREIMPSDHVMGVLGSKQHGTLRIISGVAVGSEIVRGGRIRILIEDKFGDIHSAARVYSVPMGLPESHHSQWETDKGLKSRRILATGDAVPGAYVGAMIEIEGDFEYAEGWVIDTAGVLMTQKGRQRAVAFYLPKTGYTHVGRPVYDITVVDRVVLFAYADGTEGRADSLAELTPMLPEMRKHSPAMTMEGVRANFRRSQGLNARDEVLPCEMIRGIPVRIIVGKPLKEALRVVRGVITGVRSGRVTVRTEEGEVTIPTGTGRIYHDR